MADASEKASKASKKNQKRSQKRTEARIEKIKQEGVVEQIFEEKDPIKVLKKKLQEAKDNKDHKLAAELRQQLWVAQDEAAGLLVPDSEKQKVQLHNHITKLPSGSETNSRLTMFQGTQDILNQSGPETGGLSPSEKRLRNLKKKLQQIHTLKEKQLKGEKLENTQIEKVKAEDSILEEIKELESILTGTSL
ncbi:partner of Y14 and mago-like [Actinia tenebrosa]|uniref:Partner of Y14 and mago-like n=1 Tax=Actinia tenebrosa TaxID=6105 RepID=A0A6P8H0F2_ACTTE|nr:partner of Y14 and mago-like [Actinia tenebrosa]